MNKDFIKESFVTHYFLRFWNMVNNIFCIKVAVLHADMNTLSQSYGYLHELNKQHRQGKEGKKFTKEPKFNLILNNSQLSKNV